MPCSDSRVFGTSFFMIEPLHSSIFSVYRGDRHACFSICAFRGVPIPQSCIC